MKSNLLTFTLLSVLYGISSSACVDRNNPGPLPRLSPGQQINWCVSAETIRAQEEAYNQAVKAGEARQAKKEEAEMLADSAQPIRDKIDENESVCKETDLKLKDCLDLFESPALQKRYCTKLSARLVACKKITDALYSQVFKILYGN